MAKLKDQIATISSLLSLTGVVVLGTLHISNLDKINAIQDQKQEFFTTSLNEFKSEVKSELGEQRQEIKSILKIVSRLEAIA